MNWYQLSLIENSQITIDENCITFSELKTNGLGSEGYKLWPRLWFNTTWRYKCFGCFRWGALSSTVRLQYSASSWPENGLGSSGMLIMIDLHVHVSCSAGQFCVFLTFVADAWLLFTFICLNITIACSTFASRGFSVAAPAVWNSLPSGICDSSSTHTFRHLKTHCFHQAFGSP